MMYKTLHGQLKTEQPEHHQKQGDTTRVIRNGRQFMRTMVLPFFLLFYMIILLSNR
jgi:hypothetical protein